MSVSCGRIRGLIRARTVSLYVDTPQGHRSVCVDHPELSDLYSVIKTLHDSLDTKTPETLKKAADRSSSKAPPLMACVDSDEKATKDEEKRL